MANTYNPANVTVTIGPLTLSDFMDGDAIMATQNTPAKVNAKIGLKGVVSFAENTDESGIFEIKLKQTCPQLAALEQLMNSKTIVTASIISRSDNTEIIVGEGARIQELSPSRAFGTEITERLLKVYLPTMRGFTLKV